MANVNRQSDAAQSLCRLTSSLQASRRCAFTLVELLIVILLMSITTTYVMSSFQASGYTDLQSSARTMHSSLRLARSLAVANNSQYTVTFEISANRFLIQHTGTSGSDVLPDSAVLELTTDGGGKPILIGDLDTLDTSADSVSLSTVKVGSNAVTDISFNELGEPVGRGQATVVWLQSSQTETASYISVSVAPTTGIVSKGTITGSPS